MKTLLALLPLAIAAALAPTASHAAAGYDAVDLNKKVGKEFTPKFVTAKGVVVGLGGVRLDITAQRAAETGMGVTAGGFTGVTRTFTYDGAVHDLGGPGIFQFFATAVNANTHIVGHADSRMFYYDGAFHFIEAPNKHSMIMPSAINSKDQFVGFFTISTWVPAIGETRDLPHAFFYDGSVHDLGELGGKESQALALNEQGVVVGFSKVAAGFSHAFMFDGKLHDLGVLPGSEESVATGINNSGTVVGVLKHYGPLPRDPEVDTAFIYEKGAMRALTPPGQLSHANAINSEGDVVGNVGGHGFVYHAGTVSNLDDLISGKHGALHFKDALSITDAGAVVAMGADEHLYLLTPLSAAEAAGVEKKADADAAAKAADTLAHVDPLNGSGAKIERGAADKATLTYTDAGGRKYSYVVVRPKFAAQMMANSDQGGWIHVADDGKSGVIYNVDASGNVSGKPINPMMLQMMVGH